MVELENYLLICCDVLLICIVEVPSENPNSLTR